MSNYNHVALQGRPTKDIDLRYTNENMAIARFTLAVDRPPKKTGQKEADFVSCIAFGRMAEFIGKWFGKGKQMIASGRLQTGSYKDKGGKTVYTTDVVVENAFFCGSERSEQPEIKIEAKQVESAVGQGFMDIPDDADDQGLPFN